MALSLFQKTEIGVNTLFFLILIGFIRPFIINKQIDSKFAIITTILFFIWRVLSTSFSKNIILFKNINSTRKIPDPDPDPDPGPDPGPEPGPDPDPEPEQSKCKDPYF